jgi:hypothetical protein
MTFPDPATVLRHRGPAVLVRSVVEFSGERLVCSSSDGGVWPWSRMLEGAAQTAGLLAGAQADGLASDAVIADYRDVRVLTPSHAGHVRFRAVIERRVMQFWRCRVEAEDPDGHLLLTARVTLAPVPRAGVAP